MKKTYSKPDIVFDSFALSTSVAACKYETNYGPDICGYMFDPETYIFLESVSGCTTKITEGEEAFDGLCYHVYADYGMLFGS